MTIRWINVKDREPLQINEYWCTVSAGTHKHMM